MEIVLRAMAEIFEVLDIEVVHGESHAEIFAANSHALSPLSAAPHDHRRRGRRVGPAEIGADLDIPHLTAAALAIIVGMLAFAVGADRTGIIRVMAQLAGVLDDHVHAVGVALAQMSAAGVVGPAPAELDRAAADVFAALAFLAEAVIF